MTSQSKPKRDRADYGFARARDLAFDAVWSLWSKRKSEGMKQADIAKALHRSPAWVNRSLRGPANWTLRTFGELVEALNGEITISAHAPLSDRVNYHAYAGYEPPVVVRAAHPSPTPVAKGPGPSSISQPLPGVNLTSPNVPSIGDMQS
jgi:hypothetical protein